MKKKERIFIKYTFDKKKKKIEDFCENFRVLFTNTLFIRFNDNNSMIT